MRGLYEGEEVLQLMRGSGREDGEVVRQTFTGSSLTVLLEHNRF